MLHGGPQMAMRSGEYVFAYWHPCRVCEVHEEVGVPMAKHIEIKHDEVSGSSKWAIEERHQEGDRGSSC